MADIPWHPNTHACFGVDGIVSAFLLGAQRLTTIGAASPMDPAVLEEMLEYIGTFRPVALLLANRNCTLIPDQEERLAAIIPVHYRRDLRYSDTVAVVSKTPIGQKSLLTVCAHAADGVAVLFKVGLCTADGCVVSIYSILNRRAKQRMKRFLLERSQATRGGPVCLTITLVDDIDPIVNSANLRKTKIRDSIQWMKLWMLEGVAPVDKSLHLYFIAERNYVDFHSMRTRFSVQLHTLE